MYRLLLCLRYLRTRYIALASIISVTLGVATMVVVNSVMAGFTAEMQDRIHGILSDVVFESRSLSGFRDPDWHMQQIERVAGQYIAGMTATVHVPAMLSFRYGEQSITHPVQLVGVDAATAGGVADLTKYLQHPENREQLSWQLHDGGYDVRPPEASPDAPSREILETSGWPHRRRRAERDRIYREQLAEQPLGTSTTPETDTTNPFEAGGAPAIAQDQLFDPATEQHDGLLLGIAIASFRSSDGKDHFVALPGDDVVLSYPTAATPPEIVSLDFTVVDLYESRMSEYDASFVFVPLEVLQRTRGMIDPSSGIGNATAIQIKLHRDADGPVVRDLLRGAFPGEIYAIHTWRDKQGPLLAAVQLEKRILNLLLFLIIAVAGFGILAIFYMIVVEKTRDVGILKALGASSRGVMGIFLGYGFSLGLVGAGAGVLLGLLIVGNINEIAGALGTVTGRQVFDPSIYYFYKIPTIINPWTVTSIVSGAIGIALLASVLPARRAARLHPVEALRYE